VGAPGWLNHDVITHASGARLTGHAVPPEAGSILIACGDEWSARALETLLRPSGYRVQRIVTGAAAQERARTARPDLVLIVEPLPDMTGVELCRALRSDPVIAAGLPILGLSPAPASRRQRLAWLQAGAWDFFSLPLDADELLPKLGSYVRARRDLDRSRAVMMVDPATGLYNRAGLRRRIRELVAEALRLHAGLACVVFGVDMRQDAAAPTLEREELAALQQMMGAVLGREARLSDTVGWWNGTEVAVLAPATDAEGAAKLGERLANALEALPALRVRAGYEAVRDLHATPVEPEELLNRAQEALRLARAPARGPRVRRFEARQ
jgi:PleD family two-component response regulator